MNQRTLIDRLLSPAGFGLALLLFLLPFITVSCGATVGDPPPTATITFTGLDLLVGGSPELDDGHTGVAGSSADSDEEKAAAVAEFDDQFGKYYPPQPLALLAAALILAGMIAGLVLPPARRAWPSVIAAAGAAASLAVELFLIAPGKADDAVAEAFKDAPAEAQSVFSHSTSPAIGFWLVIAVLMALAVWQGLAARGTPPAAGIPGAVPPEAPGPAPWVPPPGGPVPGAPQSGGTPLG